MATATASVAPVDAAPAAGDASNGDSSLPAPRLFVGGLSTLAFVGGLGWAAWYVRRRGAAEGGTYLRRMEEAAAAQVAQKSSVPSTLQRVPTALRSPSVGVTTAPRQEHAPRAPMSVFDASPGAPPPSVLTRAQPAASVRPAMATPSGAAGAEAPSELPEDKSSPAFLDGVKALGIATAMVVSGAVVVVEMARRVLGAKDMDDFVEKLSAKFPSIGRHEAQKEPSNQYEFASPLPTSEIVRRLDSVAEQAAASGRRGRRDPPPDPDTVQKEQQATDEWIALLEAQLSAEERIMREERRRRLAGSLS